MSKEKQVLTRIYVNAEGEVVVTDLWEEVREMLKPAFDVEEPNEFCEWEKRS